ncbi:MAG: hypothetical protein HONBIEJF_00771 [Fimbriimonadaceae bacterium]|nr:hypothetical protein [Fimbriimonadaceae bacterium]
MRLVALIGSIAASLLILAVASCGPANAMKPEELIGKSVSAVVRPEEWHKWRVSVRERNASRAIQELERSKEPLAVGFYGEPDSRGRPIVVLVVSRGLVDSLSFGEPRRLSTDQEFLLIRKSIRAGTRVSDMLKTCNWFPQIHCAIGRSELRLDRAVQGSIVDGSFSGRLSADEEVIGGSDGQLFIECRNGSIVHATVSRPPW